MWPAGSQRARRHSRSSSVVLIVLLVVLSVLFGGAAVFMWQRYGSIMRRQVCARVAGRPDCSSRDAAMHLTEAQALKTCVLPDRVAWTGAATSP